MKDTERELDCKLDEIIMGMDGSYDGLSKGIRAIARKTGKTLEIIEFIKQKNPTNTQLLEYAIGLDDSIPKPFGEGTA